MAKNQSREYLGGNNIFNPELKITNQPSWTTVVTEIAPGKFQLTVIDSDHCVFWHRHCFTSFEKADNFALKASRTIHNYRWLCQYGEAINWCFFEKFFLLAGDEDVIYRHWLISITGSLGDFSLQLHDPWGAQINLAPMNMDDMTELDANLECQRYIDAVEFSRHPCPGQLSLFEV